MEDVDIASLKTPTGMNITEEVCYTKNILNLAATFVENDMKLQILEVVREKHFGGVIIAKEPGISQKVAIKVATTEKCAKSEIEIWPSLKHPNVLLLHDIQFIPKIDSYIFTAEQHPYNLEFYLQRKEFALNKDSPTLIKQFLRDILEGLHYLHDKNLSHLNLTAKSVWITKDSKAVISNFIYLNSAAEITDGTFVPLQYGPPELYFRNNRNVVLQGALHDMWCFGLLALKIFTKNYVHKKLQGDSRWYLKVYPTLFKILQKRKFQKHCKKAFPTSKINKRSTKAMMNLVNSCMRIIAVERPPASELLKHKYFLEDEGFLSEMEEAWIEKVKVNTSWVATISSSSRLQNIVQNQLCSESKTEVNEPMNEIETCQRENYKGNEDIPPDLQSDEEQFDSDTSFTRTDIDESDYEKLKWELQSIDDFSARAVINFLKPTFYKINNEPGKFSRWISYQSIPKGLIFPEEKSTLMEWQLSSLTNSVEDVNSADDSSQGNKSSFNGISTHMSLISIISESEYFKNKEIEGKKFAKQLNQLLQEVHSEDVDCSVDSYTNKIAFIEDKAELTIKNGERTSIAETPVDDKLKKNVSLPNLGNIIDGHSSSPQEAQSYPSSPTELQRLFSITPEQEEWILYKKIIREIKRSLQDSQTSHIVPSVRNSAYEKSFSIQDMDLEKDSKSETENVSSSETEKLKLEEYDQIKNPVSDNAQPVVRDNETEDENDVTVIPSSQEYDLEYLDTDLETRSPDTGLRQDEFEEMNSEQSKDKKSEKNLEPRKNPVRRVISWLRKIIRNASKSLIWGRGIPTIRQGRRNHNCLIKQPFSV